MRIITRFCRGISFLMLPVWLAACATQGNLSVEPPTQDAKSLQSWQLVGRVGIVSPAQNGSASLKWVERPGAYRVDLVAPLNAGSMRLIGNPNEVRLISGDKQYTAATLRELSQQVTEYTVPFANLRFWVRALPNPELDVSGAQKHPAGYYQQFSQDGWDIKMVALENVSGYVLPTRLIATEQGGAGSKITISISSWQL